MADNQECTLTSARLTLEPIQAWHSEVLFDLLQDASIYTFLPTEAPRSVSALRDRFNLLARRVSPDAREKWLNWAVRVTAGGAYAGMVQATVRDDATSLLAYEFCSRFRGVGYATEACHAVVAELVAGYGVGVILAYIDTRNVPSIRLVERLGFARTAHIEGADYFKGASSDEYEYTWRVR